ncbi:MAG: TldD/PmbA family protein [Clostridiales bacterium]|nr:TldD/PmbA family protein [Clostridiales bacterium]
MLSDSNVQRIIEAGLEKNADFAEVFIEERRNSGVKILNDEVLGAVSDIDFGFGIRLMSGVNYIYVYSNETDTDKLIAMTREAAGALKSGDQGRIKELEEKCITTASVITRDPLKVAKKEYISFLSKAVDHALAFDPLITQVSASLNSSKRTIRVINSEGVNKEEDSTRIRFSVGVIATKGNEKQTSSVAPGTKRGFEFVDEYPIIEKTTECCEGAIRMINAGYAPSGKMPVVLGNGFGGVIFHEACGHALEATSVGIKASYFTDKLGEQIASPVVTAYDNARIDGEWGSYMTDDEGHTSSDLLLIENGILKNYLIDKLGSRRMGMPATGCSRRASYIYAPTSRMSNTYIAAGSDDPDDIIADTEYGLYCTKMGGGSVNTSTGDFNFAVNEAFMIRNGKVCEPVRGATLIGKGGDILKDIDRVGKDLELSAGVCGSISGNVPVTVGQPTLRVASILVGGRD